MSNIKVDTSCKQVLVVDDSEIMSRIYEMNFKNSALLQSYQIIMCKNPSEAISNLEELSSLHRITPAAILLDWVMPGKIDGLGFLKILKKSPEYSHIPVIMVTSVTQKPKIIEAINAGASDYMIKPININVLVQKLLDLTLSTKAEAV